MTPVEKANDLVNKMYMCDDSEGNYPMCFDSALQCALIAVDEIIKLFKGSITIDFQLSYKYWQEVKQEIEKL